jgi:heme-degrading monooxygenase HmoA
MKKISLFIMSIFAVGVSLAQTVGDFSAEMPVTDNNMSVVFPAGTLNDYVGGVVQAFVAGAPVSASSEIASDGSGGVAVIGTDNLCGCDLADGGETVEFAILMNGEIIVITDVNPPVVYAANSFQMLDAATLVFTIDGAVVVFGCTDAAYLEFDASANLDDASCSVLVAEGCMDAAADNYDAAANTEDGSCLYTGCMDASADNFDAQANVAGDCTYLGCMDATACNYDAGANEDDGSCDGLVGCTDAAYYEFDASATCDDGSCASLIVPGCTDAAAFNYNASATEDDGSCEAVVVGCMNPAADNFDALANTADSESCEYSGINAWGPNGGSEETPSNITSNNMSVLFPVENLGVWSGSDMVAGDVIFAVYETARLENEWVGFSEVSGIQSAGAVRWTEAQVGMPVFGADNNLDNGFQEAENIVWLVERADGVVYNASLTYATADYNGAYEDGEFVIVSSITIGAPFYDGCMDATASNFKPLATTDDGSCATPYSVGCMDVSAVNFAGAGANPTHDNAENFGDAFGQNDGINLNTGATFPSGIAANIHDQSYCQTQVEGCTDPMALNYDALATQNDETICDWSLNGMTEYDVDEHGNVLGTDYNFGSVDPENVNDGIVGSDFDNANILFEAGALDVDAHVIDNLADVMEWIDADEIADANELADTINDMQARYDANDLMWLTTYTDTLAAVEAWFAADEDADAQELADTITDMQARYDANDLMWLTTYTDTLAAVEAWFAADEAADAAHLDSTEAADDALLALTIETMQAAYDANEAAWVAYTAATLATSDSIISVTTDSLNYHRAPIEIDLHTQWNTVAYYLHHESPVVAQFENQFGSETAIAENINIVKNNEGIFYWPEFNYDGIEMLIPGQGYQVRVKDSSNGKSDFIFEHAINADAYRTITPTVPAWAIEMEVQNHPNDIRTLVRVVNMLGQEVNPAEQFNGEVLLYMYNDGTVEKKMVE